MTSKKREDSDSQKIGSDDTQPSKPTRRKVLKSLAVGSTVIGGVVTGPKWAKPIVEKVVLPAHAQTSPEPTTTEEPPPSGTKTFYQDGSFTVPERVTQIDVTVNGAGGGGGGFGKSMKKCPAKMDYSYSGGSGEQVKASLSVTSGKSYDVTIGYGGYGTNLKDGKRNKGGAGYSYGYPGAKNSKTKKEPCTLDIHGGGGGSTHFSGGNGYEASGGGGGSRSKKSGGIGGGPNGGKANKDAGNGLGASGGGYSENGANGSVIISY